VPEGHRLTVQVAAEVATLRVHEWHRGIGIGWM
jgi:hypothetical protein